MECFDLHLVFMILYAKRYIFLSILYLWHKDQKGLIWRQFFLLNQWIKLQKLCISYFVLPQNHETIRLKYPPVLNEVPFCLILKYILKHTNGFYFSQDLHTLFLGPWQSFTCQEWTMIYLNPGKKQRDLKVIMLIRV